MTSNTNQAIGKDCEELCRFCHRKKDAGGKMRQIFQGDRLPKLIYNVMHIEVQKIPGLPQMVCEKCLDNLRKFSTFQLCFRRSEEHYKALLESEKSAPMDALIHFARNIEQERQKEMGAEAKKTSAKGTTKPKKKKGHKKPKA